MQRRTAALMSGVAVAMAQLSGCAADSGHPTVENVAGKQNAVLAACTGYSVTDLGALGGPDQVSSAAGVAPGGAVTGGAHPTGSFSGFSAYLWTQAGGLTNIGSLGGSQVEGRAINDANQVAGRSFLPDDGNGAREHAFFYSPTTGLTDLGTFGGDGVEGSAAFGVNSLGTVVGYAELPDEHRHAFRWNGGALVDLGTSPSGYNSEAFAINEAGVIVGDADIDNLVHAVKWVDGTLSDLGVLSDSGVASAYAINRAGVAAGVAYQGNRWYPVVFDGGITVLPLPDGFERGIARGISDSGQIVGEAWPEAPATTHHGFVSQAGTTWDLNTLIDSPTLVVTSARGINAAGQIVGDARSTVDGLGHGVLLTPVVCSSPRGFRSVESSSGTPAATVSVPEGVQPGDVLVAALEVDADPVVVTAPLGWTLVRDRLSGAGTSAAFHAQLYVHNATATEPVDYTFAAPDDVWVGAEIAAYAGVSQVDQSASASATGTNVTAPSVNASVTGEILVAFYVDFDGGTWSTPSGLTKRIDESGMSIQDTIRSTAGATGARKAFNTTSSALTAITVTLK